MNKNKNLGFTLAEVLIVIGIIGVVAALTLPNLNHATGDKEKVTKVKKIYSSLTDAVDRAQVIYGNTNTWCNDITGSGEDDSDVESNRKSKCSERITKRITEFLKVSKDCGFNEGCFSTAPLLFADGNINEDNYLESLQISKAYMVTLQDGMSLRFMQTGSDYIKIGVDIDGPNKGKNRTGDDIFSFAITNNMLYPDTNLNLQSNDTLNEKIIYGDYATAWVIEHDNLDYLKCPNELNWETQTSCK